MAYVLAIDQGTTSTRAILFDAEMAITAIAQQEVVQHYPEPGWVEHDPEDIWRGVLATCREAMAKAAVSARDIAGIGIANQRETTVIWERATGKPIYRAIVWQDRRTHGACQRLRADGHESTISAASGLLLDPYFSATKIAWLLDNVPGARDKAERGELAFGTIDSFLLWRLTRGAAHATDATNASRTMLYDIRRNAWSSALCSILGVPLCVLPEVKDCAAGYGTTASELFGSAIPIRGMAGDQQAALIGQACFAPGMMKSTYGTGCFAVLNTGRDPVASKNRLLTTIGYRLGGETTYALEGSIFIAGAAVQWLRDGLQIMTTAADAGPMAEAADPAQDVIMVPAFAGLGAPYWDAGARGAIFGLTRGTGRNEFARAALESVCFQTSGLLDAMRADWASAGANAGNTLAPDGSACRTLSRDGSACRTLSRDGSAYRTVLRVDGGMAASDWTMQRLADLLGVAVDRPTVLETTALGAAYLAGLQSGLYPEPERFAERWALDRRFSPRMAAGERTRRVALWKDAVARTLSGGGPDQV